jgi:hypothetical protein
VLSHEPHRLHEVDEQYDNFSPHKASTVIPIVRILGPGSSLFVAHETTANVEKAARSQK